MNQRCRFLWLPAFLIVMAIAHAVYFLYDSRWIVDHDDFYLRGFADGRVLGPYPLVNGLLTVIYTLVPASPIWLAAVAFLFYAFLVVGAWALARELAVDDEAALGAALVVACLPLLDNHSRKFFLQHYPTTWLLWSLFFAARLRRSVNQSGSIVGLLGTAFAAQLTHPLAILESAPIFVFAAFTSRTASENQSKRHDIRWIVISGWLSITAAALLLTKVVGEFGSNRRRLLQEQVTTGRQLFDLANDFTASFVYFWGGGTAALVAVLLGIAAFRRPGTLSREVRAVTAVAAVELVLALALRWRGMALMGFSLAYALPPLLAVVFLWHWRRNTPGKWIRPASTLIVALLLLAATGNKAAVFWREAPRLPVQVSCVDRRVIITAPSPVAIILDTVKGFGAADSIALRVTPVLRGNGGGISEGDADIIRHSTSSLRLAARLAGVCFSNPDRDRIASARAEVVFQNDDDDKGFALSIADYLRNSGRWCVTSIDDPLLAGFFAQNQRGIRLLWQVAPQPLSPAAFLELPWSDFAGRTTEYLAVLSTDQLEGLAQAATKSGQHEKAVAVLAYLADTAGSTYRLPLVEAALHANDVETALLAWREFAMETTDFHRALAAVLRLTNLDAPAEAKATVLAALNTLDREVFCEPQFLRSAVQDALFIQATDVGAVRELVEPLLSAGQVERAERIAMFVLTLNPDDTDMLAIRLAGALAIGDRHAVAALAQRIFARDDFDARLCALRRLAALGVAAPAVEAFFRARLVSEQEREQDYPQNLYMLASLAVYERKLHADWPGALVAIARLRPLLRSDQTAGVDLEEAAVRQALGQTAASLALLEQSLRYASAADPVRAEAARLAAQIHAEQGRLERAAELLRVVAAQAADQDAFANQVADVAAKYAVTDPSGARTLLETMTAAAEGNARGLLLVEQGKLAMAAGDFTTARIRLEAANEYLTDGVVLRWTKETLAELPD